MAASLIASLFLRCMSLRRWRRRSPRFARHMTASLIASLFLRCNRHDGVARSFALLLRCNGVCLSRRRSPRFAQHTRRRVPAAPSAPSLHSSRNGVARYSLLWRRKRRMPAAPSVPSLRSLHGGVAHCFVSLALQTACACGAVGPFASLVTGWRRSLLRFSCVAIGECLWRRQSLCFARHMTASLAALLLLRCKRSVPVAPSVPSLRSSHDGIAHCVASLASQTACACGAVGPFASLVT